MTLGSVKSPAKILMARERMYDKKRTPGESNAKSLKIFPGFKYRAFSESVREMGEDLVKGGFL